MTKPTSDRHLGGIACSHCQGPTYVRESRQGRGRRIRRRRECLSCGHRFSTEEAEVVPDRYSRDPAVTRPSATHQIEGAPT